MKSDRERRRQRIRTSVAYFFVVLLPLSAGMAVLGQGFSPIVRPGWGWIALGVIMSLLSIAAPFLAALLGGYLRSRFGEVMDPEELHFSLVLLGFAMVTLLALSASYLIYKLTANFFAGVFFLILGLLGALFFLLGLKRYE